MAVARAPSLWGALLCPMRSLKRCSLGVLSRAKSLCEKFLGGVQLLVCFVSCFLSLSEKSSETQRGRDREVFHVLVQSPNGHSVLQWAHRRPGAESSYQVSRVGAGFQGLGSSSLLSQAITRELDGSGAASTQASAHMRCWLGRWRLNLLLYTADPGDQPLSSKFGLRCFV